jgi:hypothetical protein
VVAFAGKKPLESFTPRMARQDLADWKPGLHDAGFELTIPSAVTKSDELRVFGIDGGYATELKLTGNVAGVLDSIHRR